MVLFCRAMRLRQLWKALAMKCDLLISSMARVSLISIKTRKKEKKELAIFFKKRIMCFSILQKIEGLKKNTLASVVSIIL